MTLDQTTLAHYKIDRRLGSGGMATVYLAEDLKHHRKVALKVLKPEVQALIGNDRFLREIEIAARLNHPHVLPLFDSGFDQGRLYFVTPFIAGETLRERLGREGPLRIEEAVRLAREIAGALHHAHQHGLVHRDIKPGNILLSEGLALVADFGIACVAWAGEAGGETQVATVAGAILGTPRYMSPEQIAGEAVDARTDLYALGCVLYEMIAGEAPFDKAATFDLLIRQHLTVVPRPVTDHRPEVSQAVADVIARTLAKQPADRPATAAMLAEDLAAALTGGVPFTTPPVAPTRHNLPRERTSFVGRVAEIASCVRLLEEARLVTVTGIGGSGKTRLALKVAERLLESNPDGVWFVDLAPIGEAGQVLEAVAEAVGVREEAGKNLTQALRRHVAAKRVLIVLDNCEHLLAPCASLVDALLASSGELRILATSREGLGIEGERAVALRSLAIPEAGKDLSGIETFEAGALFVQRAAAAAPDFVLTRENAEAVAEICRRLDGIPLAIELAVARLRILSVEQIRSRLDDRFRLLTGGSRTALPRQQTLLATIQWSYDQLTPEEQRLLRHVSVFAGGWTLEIAGRVAASGDEVETMDVLARLVEKSLVLVDRDRKGQPRYSLLETVRQYALERLQEMAEAEEARQRHLLEYLAVAERAYAERFTKEELWAEALEAEHDNLRAAVAVARANDPERYLELSGALAWFWQVRSHFREGREHLTAALEQVPSREPRRSLARALWGVANTAMWQGDAKAAIPRMEEALEMWQSLGDREETALALESLGLARFLVGDDGTARRACEESLRLQTELGDPVLVNRARVALAQVLVGVGDLAGARALSLAIIAFSRSAGDRRNEHFGHHFLADCALADGDCAASLDLYAKSLELARELGDRLETSFELQGVAMSLAGLGRAAEGIRLFAAARAEWTRIDVDISLGFWDRLVERYVGAAKLALGPDGTDRAWSEGTRMPFEEACRAALAAPGATSPP